MQRLRLRPDGEGLTCWARPPACSGPPATLAFWSSTWQVPPRLTGAPARRMWQGRLHGANALIEGTTPRPSTRSSWPGWRAGGRERHRPAFMRPGAHPKNKRIAVAAGRSRHQLVGEGTAREAQRPRLQRGHSLVDCYVSVNQSSTTPPAVALPFPDPPSANSAEVTVRREAYGTGIGAAAMPTLPCRS